LIYVFLISPALTNTATTTQTESNTPFLPQSRVRHEWYQSENSVIVSIFIKNVKKETVDVYMTEHSVSVTVKLPTGSDYSLELDPLAHEIVPKESKYEVLSTKIEIKLKKANAGIKWGVLEGEDSLAGSISGGGGKLSYPSSAKHAKNWDALEKEISKEQDKPEGEVNALFQQLYKDADDDTKRAMLKSYTESSGTCLSTNWNEVSKSKVETKPPEGMEAKKVKFAYFPYLCILITFSTNKMINFNFIVVLIVLIHSGPND
jgi:suppressor of G2 allele of SKP1